MAAQPSTDDLVAFSLKRCGGRAVLSKRMTNVASTRVRQGHDLPGKPWVVPMPAMLLPTRSVRSTLLIASRTQLRLAGVFDAYTQHLPAFAREALDGVIAASWVPVELAHAHYAAADALDLPEEEIVALTRPSGEKLHQMFFTTAFRLARTAGLTPWTGLPVCLKILDRLFEGSGGALQQLGPKEARGVILAQPLIRHRYFRTGLVTHLDLVLGLCCHRGFIRITSVDTAKGTMALLLRWV